ncbi:hypothetical protein BH11BAC3_BH11BAC3_07190 [soil metagenome]
METSQLTQLLLDQSQDLIWMVDPEFRLIYANKAYINFNREMAGVEIKLNEPTLFESFDKGYIEKWEAYYSRALKSECFEVEEQYPDPAKKEIQYRQITFEPLKGSDDKIVAVACQSKDITRIVHYKSEANQLMDASLDVFCTINKQGNFAYVSAAASKHWGYLPEELLGKAYMNFIVEEDVPKSKEIAKAIHSGKEIKSFVNRYKKKDGSIAYNLWSARWDDNTKLMYCVARDGKEKIEQEEKIEQSHRRFESLVENSMDAILIISPEGKTSYVSASVKNILGYLPAEVMDLDIRELIHPDDIAGSEEVLARIMNHPGVPMPGHTSRIKHKNGSWRWIEPVVTNLLHDPSVNGIVDNIRDVTDKIEQEEKIQQSEERFKALVQNGSDLISITDEQGNYIYISPTSTAITGFTPDEFIGKNVLDFLHPDDIESALSSLEKLATKKSVVLEPFRTKHKNGEWRWAETVLTNMLDNPAINGIVANTRDITNKVEEQHHLKLLQSVITNTNDAILITEAEPQDEPGPKIIYVNGAFTKMTGYEAAEVIGKSPRMLQGPNSNKEELAKLGRSLRNWESHEITTINYKKSGEEFWVNFTVTPVANEKGWYTHWIAIERDVSEQKIKELEKDLLNKVSDIFNQCVDNDLTACLTNLCMHITKFGAFDLVEIWLPAVDNKAINCVANYRKGSSGNTFYADMQHLKAGAFGEEMPGYVWKNKTTEIWGNVDGKWIAKRNEAKRESGTGAVMGVPLTNNNVVAGVLLIGTEKTTEAMAIYSTLMQNLASTIGTELSRKNIEIELAQIFDFTPGIICVAGFDGYLKRINPAGLELLGYSLEEMRSQPIRSFVHEDDRLQTKDQQTNLYNGGRQTNFENRYITKQGKIVWLSWTAISTPEYGIVYAVAKDVSEEKKLRELNRQASSLAKIGNWEVDIINKTIFWSDQVHHIYETDPGSFVPNVEAAIDFYREDFRQIALSSFEQCIITGEPYSIEAVIVTPGKKELWVRTTAKAEIVDGVCTRVYGSFQDINDHKEAENKVLAISDNLPGIVIQYVINTDGTDAMRYVSGNVEQLWGFTAIEVMEDMNVVWNQVKVGGDFEKATELISKSIQTKSKLNARYRYVMPSGEVRNHLVIGTPFFQSDNTVLFNSVVLDITEEAKNEKLLEQVTKMSRIGSWEMDLLNKNGDSMYWSPMLFDIVEVDDSYNPTLTGGIEFHIGESKVKLKHALDLLIKEGTEFDIEILLRTAKGNERWSRAIGKSETVNNKRTKIYGSYQDIHEQKFAALELEKSLKALKDYKFSLDQAAIIAFTDKQGVITSVNDNFCDISKYNREELVGKTHQLINSKHHPPAFFNDLWKTIASGKVWRGEIKNKAKDGSYYWVDTTIVPFLDKKNKPVQYLAIRFDITPRKNSEIKLAESENRFRTILEAEPECIKLLGPGGELLMMNPAGLGMIEANSEEQVLGKSMLEIILPEHRLAFKKLTKNVFTGESGKLVFEIEGLKGHHRWLETHAVPMKNEQGEIISLLGVTRDITERKKAEREKNNLQSTLENSLNEIYIFDAETFQFSYVNKGGLHNLGYSKHEINALTPLDIKPDFTASSFQELITPLVTNEKEKIIFFTNHKRKDGSLYPVEVHLQFVKELNNNRFLAIILDITKRTKAEENLLTTSERLRLATTSAKMGIWDWDIVNDIVIWDDRMYELYGIGKKDFTGTVSVWQNGVHPDDIKKAGKELNDAITGTEDFNPVFRVIWPDQSVHFIEGYGIVTRNEAGEAVRMIGGNIDITKRKAAEEAIRFNANLLSMIA